MDDADRADALSSIFLREQIRKARGPRSDGAASQAAPGAPRFCLECGAKIPRQRIEVVPECTLCTECQHEFEQKER